MYKQKKALSLLTILLLSIGVEAKINITASAEKQELCQEIYQKMANEHFFNDKDLSSINAEIFNALVERLTLARRWKDRIKRHFCREVYFNQLLKKLSSSTDIDPIAVEKDKKIAETKLEDLNSQRISIGNQLESQISIQTNIDNQLQEMDSNKSVVSNELRNLEKEINDLRLELRTHEINLENASIVLEKAEVSISDLDSAQYKGMDLKGLEVSLDEIQKNIAQLGSVNLAAPEEYLSRENELKKLIEEAEIRKSEIQVIMDLSLIHI